MKRRIAVFAVALASGGLAPLQPQSAGTAPEAVLYRCSGRSSTPCLLTTATLEGEAARLAGETAPAWRARFLRDSSLAGFARPAYDQIHTPVRLLVLMDVSGSMLGLRTHATRRVLDEFLAGLDSASPGTVRVAVAPFESRRVRAGILAAAFTAPDSARVQVARLPEPDREGNTGLYSAVVYGLDHLRAAVASAPAGTLGVLVIITDGENSVTGARDDPGLLEGPSGLAQAQEAVDGSPARLWLVGIGQVDRATLEALAGSRGKRYLLPLEVDRLTQVFAELQRSLWATWYVVFPTTAVGREELGQGWAPLTIQLASPGKTAGTTWRASWRPPKIALPVYEGVEPGLLPVEVAQRGSVGIPSLDRRIPSLVFLAVLLVGAWLVLPRVLWPPVGDRVPVATAAGPAPVTPPKAVTIAGGLRRDVHEAAARKPSDVTAAKGRRRAP